MALPAADLCLRKCVLHHWDRRELRPDPESLREAMVPGGRVAIIESNAHLRSLTRPSEFGEPVIEAIARDRDSCSLRPDHRLRRVSACGTQVSRNAGHNPTLDGDVAVPRDTRNMFDLVLPLECGGCGAPSTRWCPACARQLAVKPDQPHLITPRVDPGVPVFSLGRYAGRAPRSHRRRQRARPRRPHRAARRRPARRAGAPADMGCHRDAADRRPRANPPIVRQAPRRRSRHPDGAGGHGGPATMSTSRRRCDCGRLVRDSVGLSGADRAAQHRRSRQGHQTRRRRSARRRRHRDHRRHCLRIGPRPAHLRCSRGRCACDRQCLTTAAITPDQSV